MIEPILRYLGKNQFLLTIIIIALGWFLLQIKEILISFFVSYIIMAALSPLVDYLTKKSIPKLLAVTISYVSVLCLILLIILPIIPFFIAQLESLFTGLPIYLDQASQALRIDLGRDEVSSFFNSELGAIGHNAVELTGRVFGGLFTILTILVVSYYLLLSREKVRKEFAEAFPQRWQKRTELILVQVNEKLGAWLRGQIVLSIFIGTLTWITLTVLQLDYALPLAVLAGILEIVPTIGPIIASIPAIIVALTISPTMAIIVAAAYILIQMIENNVLVPKIMEKAVGLNPIMVIFAVTVGAKLMGVLGALLAVPFVVTLVIVINNIREYEMEHS